MKIFEFPFQAKVILGFTASVGLEEMSIELIHMKFMAKLQLVTVSEMLICFGRIRAETSLDEWQDNNSNIAPKEKDGSSSENQSSSQAYHDIHEVKPIYTIENNSKLIQGMFRSDTN